ncbi:short-chain dehydrogenase [Advenella kashmirensis W13003]|uniref:Short-chain dehydrogenase n=1 Tax=Advenella kashmirensis W13003 TaxID=1424334 RepID=V8QZG9_9BURK|nr:SDR family oxidoreductase [Advenella kashmirensis]ETF04419.1 short-chain dehydrogenase [Advenella kashmirensis W13003]
MAVQPTSIPTVLITGAASGIGRASAVLFASRGWRCVLVDRNVTALAEVLDTLAPIRASDEIDALTHMSRTVDLTVPADIESLTDPTLVLDAVVNNAGMSDTSGLLLTEQDAAHLDRLVALNLRAPALVIDAVAAQLVPGARIVNVASGAALHAIPLRGAYSATKAGLLAQTQALAAARPDLCVTALCPGFVRTELVAELIDIGRLQPENIVAKIPLGRMAEPQDMAEALYFLASEGAAPLSGERLSVDGGSAIFGGSKPFAPATQQPLPFDSTVHYQLAGNPPAEWASTPGIQETPVADPHYSAVLDFSCLQAERGQMLQAVHEAARRFAGQNGPHSSLILLMPSQRATGHWQQAGDMAAARMLVCSLACELGARAMRVNAIEIDPNVRPDALVPLLRFVGGARTQFLTGQTIRAHVA